MKKGRSRELIELRDRKLLRRYHELTEVERLRSDDALRLLSRDEFFISEDRIWAILQEKAHLIPEVILEPKQRPRKPRLSTSQRLVLGL